MREEDREGCEKPQPGQSGKIGAAFQWHLCNPLGEYIYSRPSRFQGRPAPSPPRLRGFGLSPDPAPDQGIDFHSFDEVSDVVALLPTKSLMVIAADIRPSLFFAPVRAMLSSE